MSDDPAQTPPAAGSRLQNDVAWNIARRIQEYHGEARANLLRLLGIGAFFIIHIVNYRILGVRGIDAGFHAAVTALTVAWTLTSAGIVIALRSRLFPPWLKYASTGVDALLLTLILLVADGPRSALVVAYLLIVPLAGLRMSPKLVGFATAACAAGYVVLLGNAAWYRPVVQVARYQQMTFFVAVVLCGLVIIAMLRAARHVALDYGDRVQSDDGAPAGPRVSPEQTERSPLLTILVCAVVLLVVGVELALSWPGLLVPFAVIGLPIVATLVRIAVPKSPGASR